jgi:hypothetical protein
MQKVAVMLGEYKAKTDVVVEGEKLRAGAVQFVHPGCTPARAMAGTGEPRGHLCNLVAQTTSAKILGGSKEDRLIPVRQRRPRFHRPD